VQILPGQSPEGKNVCTQMDHELKGLILGLRLKILIQCFPIAKKVPEESIPISGYLGGACPILPKFVQSAPILFR
jgi:hypothetical protein